MTHFSFLFFGRLTSSLQAQVPFYSMTAIRRGKFVLISNKTFSLTSSLPTRQGADIDTEMLTSIFRQLGFDVTVHLNLTAQEMSAIFDTGMYVCYFMCLFVCIVVSHRLFHSLFRFFSFILVILRSLFSQCGLLTY